MRILKRTGIVTLILLLSACAGHLTVKQQIDRADRTAYVSLRGFQEAEESAWHAKAAWPTASEHQKIGATLSKAYQGVIDLATIGIDLKPGDQLPPQAATLIRDLTATVIDLTALVSDQAAGDLKDKLADVKSTVNALIAQIQQVTTK